MEEDNDDVIFDTVPVRLTEGVGREPVDVSTTVSVAVALPKRDTVPCVREDDADGVCVVDALSYEAV